MRRAMDLIHYVVKDGVLDSAAQLAHITSQHNAAQVANKTKKKTHKKTSRAKVCFCANFQG